MTTETYKLLETQRLAAVRRLHLLDTPAEERFDRITRLARRAFNVAIAHVSLIDEKRQWYKSIQGLSMVETPRSSSICAHAILQDDPLILEDVSADARFQDNHWTVDQEVRFYAGHPVKGPDGNKVGTLCLMDHQSRQMTSEDLQAFHDLASLVEKELQVVHLSQTQSELIHQLKESQRAALLDGLTRIWNRRGVFEILNRELSHATRRKVPLGLILADIDHFKAVNDTFGHPAGDSVLQQVAQILRSSLRPYDAVGRYGGEEFLIVVPGCDRTLAALVARRILRLLEKTPLRLGNDTHAVTMSFGVTAFRPRGAETAEILIKEADHALYRAKRQGRDRVVTATPPSRKPSKPKKS